jgi:hypothetical protein
VLNPTRRRQPEALKAVGTPAEGGGMAGFREEDDGLAGLCGPRS